VTLRSVTADSSLVGAVLKTFGIESDRSLEFFTPRRA